VDVADARQTLGDWAQRCWDPMTGHLAPKSKARSDEVLRVHVLPRFGSTPLARINKVAIAEWIAELHREGGLSPETVRKALWELSHRRAAFACPWRITLWITRWPTSRWTPQFQHFTGRKLDCPCLQDRSLPSGCAGDSELISLECRARTRLRKRGRRDGPGRGRLRRRSVGTTGPSMGIGDGLPPETPTTRAPDTRVPPMNPQGGLAPDRPSIRASRTRARLMALRGDQPPGTKTAHGQHSGMRNCTVEDKVLAWDAERQVRRRDYVTEG
jgi:Phage integrase, N-terminal SAM-like domain